MYVTKQIPVPMKFLFCKQKDPRMIKTSQLSETITMQ